MQCFGEREVTAFEIAVFCQFSADECRIIEERRRPELKLGFALQIGFLRMSGRLLEAVRFGSDRIVPPRLWRHLGARVGVAAPDLASLGAMYRRVPTQCIACGVVRATAVRNLTRARNSVSKSPAEPRSSGADLLGVRPLLFVGRSALRQRHDPDAAPGRALRARLARAWARCREAASRRSRIGFQT